MGAYDAVPGLIVGEGIWGYSDPSPDPPTEQEIIDLLGGIVGGFVTLTTAQTITGLKTFTPSAASAVGVIVKGLASQTGDLFQAQDSAGTPLVWINSFGSLIASKNLYVTPYQVNNVAFEVSGLAAQTGDLQQWKNSAGTVLVKVTNVGQIRSNVSGVGFSAGGSTDVAYDYPGVGNAFYWDASEGRLTITAAGATITPIVVKGAASQTADLQQWQNSAGMAVARMSKDGHLLIGDDATAMPTVFGNAQRGAALVDADGAALVFLRSAQFNMLDDGGRWQAGWNARGAEGGLVTRSDGRWAIGRDATLPARLSVQGDTAADAVLIARGAAAQTADLQQWQDSAGTVLVSIAPDGKLLFGSAGDVNLYRLDANAVKSDDNIVAGLDLWARITLAEQVRVGAAGPASQAGLAFGASQDVNLYRLGANELATDDALTIGAGGYLFLKDAATASTIRLYSNIAADTNYRLVAYADGKLEWGPGNAARDVNLYRLAANQLKTDDEFDAGLNIVARHNDASELRIGNQGPTGEAGIKFGSAGDVNLYRSAANILKTDDVVHIGQDLAIRIGASTQLALGDVIGGGIAGITFGSAQDVNLYRSAADTLKTDDAFRAGSFIDSQNYIQAFNGQAAEVVMGDFGPANEAGIRFGSAGDTNLYRSAANTLKTDDALIVGGDYLGVNTWYLGNPVVYAGGASSGGNVLSFGNGAPNNANGSDGDIYLRDDGGAGTTIYQRRTGAWVGIV